MTATLHHRGPDGRGAWDDDRVALGHTRLAVIDRNVAANQPMIEKARNCALVYNGEIYNFRDLRRELEALGHSFRTQGDTEVLLNGYCQWGDGVIERLRGMFAFAIWDAGRKRLLLACDRVGQKPLYSAWHEGKLFFASEIKAILAWPGFPRVASYEAINHYMTYQYVPAPLTAFEGVQRLEAAHKLVQKGERQSSPERYWSLPSPGESVERPTSVDAAELREKLDDAVKSQLVADVPIGVFLSGGVDSSSVVAMVRRHTTNPVKTFTIGFAEQNFDERRFARDVAEHFETDHLERIVRPNSLDVLPKIVWHYDQPFADPSAVASYYLADLAKDTVTVALNGDGADESLMGYPRYTGLSLSGPINKIPYPLRRIVSMIAGRMPFADSRYMNLRYIQKFLIDCNLSDRDRYEKWISFFTPPMKKSIYGSAFKHLLESSSETLLDPYFEIDAGPAATGAWADLHTYLPGDLLVKMDIACMAHGVEARSPFLDHKLMEYMARIPAKAKMKRLETKLVLKKAMAEYVPASALNRRKMGFGVPIDEWLRSDLKEFAYDTLLARRTRQRGIFSTKTVKSMLDAHCRGHSSHHYQIWALLILELWFRMWIDAREPPTAAPGVKYSAYR